MGLRECLWVAMSEKGIMIDYFSGKIVKSSHIALCDTVHGTAMHCSN